jgi:hypothetical protein
MTSSRGNRPHARIVHGAPSWRIANDVVEGWLTREGGHLGPVEFKTSCGKVQPFSVSPWLPREVTPDTPRVLRHLRGDFFCLPFGDGAAPWHGERHPLHGETSGGRWELVNLMNSGETTELVTRMRTRIRSGVVTKRVRLKAGQTVLYCSHEIEGMSGRMCLGHHAMLRFPDRPNAARIAFSRIRFGQVRPSVSEAQRHSHSALKSGAVFQDLSRVPSRTGGYADLTRYPARKGSDDLVLLAARSSRSLAWTAVTFPKERYLWFALKNPKQLTATLLWHSNGGFRSPPWNGRHRPVLGIEDITAFFDFGLAASARANSLSRLGVATTLNLRSSSMLRIPYVMGVTAIPGNFKLVQQARFGPGHVAFVSESGATVRQELDLSFFSD